MKILYYFIIFLFLISTCAAFGQSGEVIVTGKVTDDAGKPIEFANISCADLNISTSSNAGGNFSLSLRTTRADSTTLSITFVGKRAVSIPVSMHVSTSNLVIKLQALSLTLNEVQINSQRKRSNISNSSIIFDREAIEQVQAYSLADVLNNLPGKRMSAPDLQYNQQATLRSASTTGDPVQQANNARGVAIYVDDIRQSNDANMQTRGVGAWGITGGAIGNIKDPLTGSPQYDTPFGGLDIRNIPADNIESIEVVSGVASAKYGELTDGAIIIKRMAGKTDYRVNLRLNGASTNASVSKGFNLGKRLGAINVNFNYLNSIQTPTDNLKNYGRVSGGLMWTTKPFRNLRNTFSADYSHKIDNRKIDPDDSESQMMYSKEQRLSLSNRMSLEVNNSAWLERASFSVSYDEGYQESYRQRTVNSAVVGVADKDTTGIYEGYFRPGNYLSVDHIKGRPYNGSASLDLVNTVNWGSFTHNISLGGTFSFSGNKGEGVLSDPDHPFFNINAGGNRGQRPYPFDLLRNIYNGGVYLEDKATTSMLGKPLTLSAGVRYDVQNGFPSWQPRINASYNLSTKWSVNAAFGIASKAPSMSFRYPAPSYFDIPLLNIYNGKVNESVFLAYTQKIIKDNSNLKPSKSNQVEVGLRYDGGWLSSSLSGYIKRNRDGLNSVSSYLAIYLPTYDTVITPGQKPVYTPTGNLKLYGSEQDRSITNSVKSDNYGLEWFVSTKKVRSIQTSFNLNTSFSYSKYENVGAVRTEKVDDNFIIAGRKAWYGIYPAEQSQNWAVMSKLTTNTHIPKLGFIVSIMADIYWSTITYSPGKNAYPIAYIDKDGIVNPIPVFDPTNTDYNYLVRSPEDARRLKRPAFVYSNLSARLSKEIKKKVNISIYAYNFLNLLIRDYDRLLDTVNTYNNPVNVGAEISFKL
ncbi:TonB-dependent receptor [Mucilaginibacter conchicola]|uniref:TonB-dependent receptor n=1 Tax=Mucilaginibacter conchicola TaxID=2303333 RepID=A0A372NZD6_9SPHI|nr:TonB-dependent receptor [Mucilaginibacter conchicola]RFZ94877.1 TonB-dependent receptor [Mucilaginibacter conchicola]